MAIGIVGPALVGAAWAIVWLLLGGFIVFLTCAPGKSCFMTTTYLPGMIIPILYLPFLTRAIVLLLTKDRAAAQVALYVAIAWSVLFSFWLSWWSEYGTLHFGG
ncbi:MAG: hypothetical protein M1343_05520 [Chloroflexi bacterium]|nr:hypothetical protein [Chloroflexota bacterium]